MIDMHHKKTEPAKGRPPNGTYGANYYYGSATGNPTQDRKTVLRHGGAQPREAESGGRAAEARMRQIFPLRRWQ